MCVSGDYGDPRIVTVYDYPYPDDGISRCSGIPTRSSKNLHNPPAQQYRENECIVSPYDDDYGSEKLTFENRLATITTYSDTACQQLYTQQPYNQTAFDICIACQQQWIYSKPPYNITDDICDTTCQQMYMYYRKPHAPYNITFDICDVNYNRGGWGQIFRLTGPDRCINGFSADGWCICRKDYTGESCDIPSSSSSSSISVGTLIGVNFLFVLLVLGIIGGIGYFYLPRYIQYQMDLITLKTTTTAAAATHDHEEQNMQTVSV